MHSPKWFSAGSIVKQLEEVADSIVQSVATFVARAKADILRQMEERIGAIPAGPIGPQGIQGEMGAPGERGERGEAGASGRDGVDGQNGKDGRDGVDGKEGPPGKDGASVTAEDFRQMFEAAHSKWLLDIERRIDDKVQHFLERIPPPADGKDGKDGRDGFSAEDISVEHDGERLLTIRLARGEHIVEKTITLSHPLYRGVFEQGRKYERGDSVTFGGSQWIAKRETQSRPESNDDWQLAVKRGRDGKSS